MRKLYQIAMGVFFCVITIAFSTTMIGINHIIGEAIVKTVEKATEKTNERGSCEKETKPAKAKNKRK
jgi:hypothetical protein